MPDTVLIVDDDEAVLTMLRKVMKSSGIDSEVARSGGEAIELAGRGHYDLMLLDVNMPGMDGFEVIQTLRGRGLKLPIIIVSGRKEDYDALYGLDIGADDYLTKPFDTRELLACVGALLRRQGGQGDQLAFGNTVLDLDGSTLACGDRWVRLSAREFDVMRFLLQARDRISPKEAILEKVWGYDSNAVENHVEVYVGFLRKKLGSIGSNVRIEAVRRLGYHLETDGT